ncbi:RNA 3'-terminal phosphate cyclase-like protein [Xenia sp. Carnegie-2017]|uniref:RNA 3'-terminal phosphate cyclase-like protein n=1 Tax=Xenia sp. Carnegie-2017 TaxID=2897299 RepID=UPI001F03EFFE|nr:RNA 3'-terminal phosphate cyclase-like protein [Xenia sp. Carnegie-2017]
MAADLNYEGCNFYRQRLVLSTLSGKSVMIKNIRTFDDDPGLCAFEAGFIRLLDKITNGSKIEVNETGTSIFYKPGLLIGGTVDHDCSLQRSIGYFLESVVCLAPFCKRPLQLTLRGVTNDGEDPSVDIIKTVTIPLMKRFLLDDEGLDLKIVKRGAAPNGGGEVVFSCPVRRTLRPLHLNDAGKIKRVRGLAYSVRVSPAMVNRIVDAAREILNKCVSDIYIYTDHCKGAQAGRSPGFGLSLVAESTKGTLLSAEGASKPADQEGAVSPEDIGRKTAMMLLEEIYRGGCVDSKHQSLPLLFMALGQRDVSKLLTGVLSSYTIQFLRHLRDFFGVVFKVQSLTNYDDEDIRTGCETRILLSCVGVGYSNVSKSIT